MAVVLPDTETDAASRALVDGFQRDFPLVPQPFAAIGTAIGLSEAAVIDKLLALSASGAVSRVGAVVRPHAAGASTLAAVAAPPADIERHAAIIDAFDGVNHNYERENAWNLWFVVTGRDWTDVESTLAGIAAGTGLEVLNLPLEKSYHIDLGFSLFGSRATKPAQRALTGSADAADRALLAAIESGLPLVERPFLGVAAKLGWSEASVLTRLSSLVERGIVTRFGVIVRHRAFGYVANAMAVWDIEDTAVDTVAEAFAAAPGVTLCYRRPRRLPHWRYNLFTMVHGRDRAAALAVVEKLATEAGSALAARDVLFSLRCFKQRGAVFSRREAAA